MFFHPVDGTWMDSQKRGQYAVEYGLIPGQLGGGEDTVSLGAAGGDRVLSILQLRDRKRKGMLQRVFRLTNCDWITNNRCYESYDSRVVDSTCVAERHR